MTAVQSGLSGRIVVPPSMADLATDAIRAMIFSGELALGERLVEARLTERLGVSRPPLREALQRLGHEGLVASHPRRGATVRRLSRHDVYEIVTLREELESIAVRLGIPVRSPARLARCHDALRSFSETAREADESRFLQRKFDFHLAVVDLAGHSRLTDAYRALSSQLQLCMALNRTARRDRESLLENVERHRELLAVIEDGDPQIVQQALTEHGHGSFLLDVVDQLDGGSPESEEWLARRRGRS
ncbi:MULTISPECIES: GntR family transcriptional regulator [Pseudonocardia]|uniref:HTH-type transcriptional regulator McbR n=2 Tax=Pseudonocardia TaxID=1847 RepID=A0A1Y2MRL6_PSEAH|nr:MULTISPECIES: GntR family transcriptional regulator [Pseudonocardia]OSY37860.1 HTH-type transcriptional regulator McbR [Pseudonocardia autotrophica]TDN72477.1 GntR family transcriptional regulator [Pseudonocardia autotrophica]BBG03186.1 GntR family transcriptional regulator [Pseudonocardia autotrophica]GEC23802.1 GntR family transcriptional regulator [Pseudonocardia saturnea]